MDSGCWYASPCLMIRNMYSEEPAPAGQPVATPAQTRAALINRSGRAFVPLAKPFVQDPDKSRTDRHGPLATFVKNGDQRGLLTFLFLHTIISSGSTDQGWSTALPLGTWARALGTAETTGAPPIPGRAQEPSAAAKNAVSKIFARLESRRLITRRRTGTNREVQVTLLAVDGSGNPYTRPQGTNPSSRFLRLSHRFWEDGWDQKLSMPGLAMLLVCLHEKPGFALPTENMTPWYGWSPDTAERGFAELEHHQLLRKDKQYVAAPLSPTGQTVKNIYTLLPPFDTASVDQQTAALKRKNP